MKSSKSILKGIRLLAMGGLVLVGCTPDAPTENPDNVETPKIDEPKEVVISPATKVDGAMFSIPSPIQLGGIIKKSGAAYNKDLLNNPKNSDQYVDLVSQSLNLGVYGADLGYCALYDKQQESIGFMKSAQGLSETLGISDAFDMVTIQAIERNLDNKDSLLYVISNSYRKADDFLQTSDRKHIGALVIVGGWIESLNFAGALGKENKTENIVDMIGMQKHTVNTILDKMLERYVAEPGVEEVYNDLDDIRMSFEKVNIKYEFVKPNVNKEKKVTTIKSKTSVEMTDEVFKEIVEKIAALRAKIINA